MFDWQRLESTLLQRMQGERLRHVYGVAETAARLAGQFGANVERARAAGLMHDYARPLPVQAQMDVARRLGLIRDPMEEDNGALLHAPVGAALLLEEGLITDAETLSAIRWHTTGRPGMSLLERILWIADMVEPGRDFPGVAQIRALALQDLDLGLMAGLDHTLAYVVASGRPMHPLGVQARNWLLAELARAGRPWPGYRLPG